MNIFLEEKINKIAQLSVTKQWIVLSIASTLLITGNYFFWICSARVTGEFIADEIHTLQSDLNLYQHRWKNHQQLEQAIKKLEQELQTITAHWHPHCDKTQTIQTILNISKQTGLGLISLREKQLEPRAFYTIHPLKMQLTGSYQQFILFLKRITKLSRGISFESLNLNITERTNALESTIQPLRMNIVWVIPELQTVHIARNLPY